MVIVVMIVVRTGWGIVQVRLMRHATTVPVTYARSNCDRFAITATEASWTMAPAVSAPRPSPGDDLRRDQRASEEQQRHRQDRQAAVQRILVQPVLDGEREENMKAPNTMLSSKTGISPCDIDGSRSSDGGSSATSPRASVRFSTR